MKSNPDLYDLYEKLMEAVQKQATFTNFQKNKDLMKFIGEKHKVASMSELQQKEFYSGTYRCPLFIKD